MSEAAQFEVLGGSIVGQKAGMLREHAPLIEAAGLRIPPTTVIAGEALRETGDMAAAELGGHVLQVVRNHETAPFLMVRSSAEGDARGSGVYHSGMAINQAADVSRVLDRVLASFHTDYARGVREQAGLGDDFAVMIQPLVGQRLGLYKDIFGPPLSGYGYSSTPAESEGYLNIVAGLGGGVSRQGGERVTPQLLRALNQDHGAYAHLTSFEQHVETQATRFSNGQVNSETDFRLRPSAFNFTGPLAPVKGSVVVNDLIRSGELIDRVEDVYYEGRGDVQEPMPLLEATRLFAPGRFLETLQGLEQTAGYPLYVEWAMTTNERGDRLIPWIVQIAPVETKDLPLPEAVPFKRVFFNADDVRGNGQARATTLVTCNSTEDLQHLREFNGDPANDGYILVYSSALTTDQTGFSYDTLIGPDCSRAIAVLERPDLKHKRPPIEHFKGGIDLTGRFFGVLNSEGHDLDATESLIAGAQAWQSPNLPDSPLGKLAIIEADFTIAADQNSDSLKVGEV